MGPPSGPRMDSRPQGGPDAPHAAPEESLPETSCSAEDSNAGDKGPLAATAAPLCSFSAAMPWLPDADIDLQAMPYPIQVALAFLRTLCPRSHFPDEQVAQLPVLLPPQREDLHGRRTLVLDLDETLVHCHPTLLDGCPDPALKLWIEVANQQLHAHIYVRPFAQLFLQIVARVFEVIVFTASAAIYADKVLDFLDPSGHCIAHRLYREHCTEMLGAHFKDMRRLGRRSEHSVLVDNSPLAAGLTPESAIVVASWFGDDYEDTELLHLLDVLDRCAVCDSIPAFLDARYGFAEFLQRRREEAAVAFEGRLGDDSQNGGPGPPPPPPAG